MAEEQGTPGSGLSDDERARLRAIAAERVADFPPLERLHPQRTMSRLNLKDVKPGWYELICLPLALQEDGAPARAVLRTLPENSNCV